MKIDVKDIAAVDEDKSKRLRWIIMESKSLQAFVAQNKTCKFFVNNTSNPASIWDPQSQKGHLLIQIAKWFLKGYSAGYIVGMMCHEVGAHFMATPSLLKQSPCKYKSWIKAGKQDANQTKDTRLQDEATGWWYKPSQATQVDHIYASCYLTARYEYYRRLMVEFAEIIAEDIEDTNKITTFFTQQDLDDLIDCWLMDVASLLATSDARGWGVVQPWYVATAFNAHLAKLQADIGVMTKNTTLEKAVASTSTKSALTVFSAYSDMAVKLFG